MRSSARRRIRKRWRHPVMVLLSVVFMITILTYLHPPPPSKFSFLFPLGSPEESVAGTACRHPPLRHLLNHEKEENKTAQFPEDLFTLEQRRKGAVVCHLIGTVYMFVALAIVCDEFFVPSLDVITEKLGISEDVAGATFMAAGGSAPELFTSIIGVFISYDDVGIGTIVGSAVFNILFVISMCALFSKTVLALTWWPLFRDVTFYSITLIILIACFIDNVIYWYEATSLLSCYLFYVTFMKFNAQIELFVKKFINRNKVTRVGSADQLVPNNRKRRMSAPMLHGGGTKFRNGLVQLMIHSIDPLHDGKLDEKATQLHAIASLRVLLDATKGNNGVVTRGPPSCPVCGRTSCDHVQETSISTVSGGRLDGAAPQNAVTPGADGHQGESNVRWVSKSTPDKELKEVPLTNGIATPGNPNETAPSTATMESCDDEEKPLDMSWPDTWRKRITYLCLLPLLFPLWLTLPDVRRQEKKKWFPMTFIGSILWIAVFSYLMVWWASLVGETVGIPNEVMGLTFLAAGTSIPDLITSVLVARKGFGDMAVSSSVGSNIFDVAVGLPLPWLLSCLIFGPVAVSSSGMVCSIIILFMMLLFVIISIAAFKWKMNVGLAMVMFLLYFVFIAVSLMFEYGVLNCDRIMGGSGEAHSPSQMTDGGSAK